MSYNIQDIFNFLPIVKVKASELKRGNVAKLFQRWDVIIDSQTDQDDYNNGWNQNIHLVQGTCFLPPEQTVSIIKPEIIDNAAIQSYIDECIKAEEQRQRDLEEEEEEERQREIEELEYRLNCLKD